MPKIPSKLLFLALFLLALLPPIHSKRFTLKGDPLWPTAEEIADLASRLNGTLQTEDDPDFQVGPTYNLRTGPPRPSIIVRPSSREDIAEALRFARDHVIRVAVSSTGHHQDVRNTADQALRLELSLLNHRRFHANGSSSCPPSPSFPSSSSYPCVSVGPGQNFADIHKFLYEETGGQWVLPSGAEPGVGPAGWSLGGGHGRLTRLYGLGVDVLVRLEVVLANGTFLSLSEQEHPEIFRAFRGGAGNALGIVYSLTFRLFPDPGPYNEFLGIFPPLDYVANSFQEWMKGAPNNAGGYYLLQYDFNPGGGPFVFMAAYCLGPKEECAAILAPLAEIPICLGAPEFCSIEPRYPSYSVFLKETSDQRDPGGTSPLYLVSTALDFSEPEELAIVTRWQAEFDPEEWPGAVIGCSGNAILGGASRDMDPAGQWTSVAPAMRKGLMAITCYVGWSAPLGKSRPDLVEKIDQWADTVLRPLGVEGWVYWNEPQHNLGAGREWQERYWGAPENYAQLRAVKDMVDPENVLTCYHCVGWEDVENVDPAVCPDRCTCSNMLEEDTCASPTFP